MYFRAFLVIGVVQKWCKIGFIIEAIFLHFFKLNEVRTFKRIKKVN